MTREQRIRQILREDWDPIRLGEDGPADEYDAYLPSVIMYASGYGTHGTHCWPREAAAVAAYLMAVRVQSMGLPATTNSVHHDARIGMMIAGHWGKSS